MAKAKIGSKKAKPRPAIIGILVVLVVLVGLYLLAKTVFWIALAVVAVIGAVYLYKLANKKDDKAHALS